MVTLITDKLRNQRLDDVQFEPIPQFGRRSWDVTTAGLGLGLASSALSDKTCLPPSDISRGSVPSTRARHASLETSTPATRARHASLEGSRAADAVCSTPPPLKRHCRSLSIPGDLGPPRPWQPHPGSVWKPVALRGKRRNSPLHKHRHSSGPDRHGPATYSPIGGPPGSADSAGEPPGLWSGSDCFSTPPESPVPRPASASSGFYDSSQGSLCAPWLDNARNNTFKVRSFSMEESISDPSVVLPPGGVASAVAAGSMPVIPGSVSTPSSPRRCRVPRCRSQPCDLHDRKCGVKRRRDDDRPTLDFFKMKETAYDRSGRLGGRIKNVQFAEQEYRISGRILPSIFSEPPECFLGLNTIASSPLDSHTVLPPVHSRNADTPSTPLKHGSNSETAAHPHSLKHGSSVECIVGDVFPGVDPRGRMTTRSILVPAVSKARGGEDYEDKREDEEETEDKQDSEEEPAGVEVFQIDMNYDLDLEQIEKD